MNGGTKHTLLIPLTGPMQSWGSRSRFDDRDTHQEPTKSAVLGLICAAKGWGREDTASLSRLNALRFGVRTDAPGRTMVDYHTAQEVIRASGSGTSAVTSQRHYLSDARFLVGLEGDDIAFLRELEAGLKDPVWFLALGRKSFPLTLPPYFPEGSVREGRELKQALCEEPWRYLDEWELQEWRKPSVLNLMLERPDGEIAQNDAPLDFERRRFGLRRFKRDSVEWEKLEKKEWIPRK